MRPRSPSTRIIQPNQKPAVASPVTCLALWTPCCSGRATTRLMTFPMPKRRSDSGSKRVQTRAYCAILEKVPNGRGSNYQPGSDYTRETLQNTLHIDLV